MLRRKSSTSHFSIALLIVFLSHSTVLLAQEERRALTEMSAKVYDRILPTTVNINCNNGLVRGSGAVVGLLARGNAVILTACHVVAANFADAATDPDMALAFYEDITVKVSDTPAFVPVIVIPRRFDKSNDVALLVSLSPVHRAGVIRYNRSSGVRPGQKVAAFGFPDSDQLSQTVGLIKRLEEKFLVFDAKIAPGSSGGPLVDKSGRMIGLSIATLNEEGFALPMDLVLSIADGWLKNMNLAAMWQRQKYTSFGNRLFKDPRFIALWIGGLGGGAAIALTGGGKGFGPPPAPPSGQ